MGINLLKNKTTAVVFELEFWETVNIKKISIVLVQCQVVLVDPKTSDKWIDERGLEE